MLTYLSQNGFGRFILFIVEKLRARKPPVDSDAMRPKLTSAKKWIKVKNGCPAQDCSFGKLLSLLIVINCKLLSFSESVSSVPFVSFCPSSWFFSVDIPYDFCSVLFYPAQTCYSWGYTVSGQVISHLHLQTCPTVQPLSGVSSCCWVSPPAHCHLKLNISEWNLLAYFSKQHKKPFSNHSNMTSEILLSCLLISKCNLYWILLSKIRCTLPFSSFLLDYGLYLFETKISAPACSQPLFSPSVYLITMTEFGSFKNKQSRIYLLSTPYMLCIL